MVVYWNKGAELMFGYTGAEANGRSFLELVVPEDRVKEVLHFREEVLTSDVVIYESIRRRRDGSLLYVDESIKAIRDAEGALQCLLTQHRDVTHLKSLRQSKLIEAKFRDLLESTPDAIVIANVTGGALFLSTARQRRPSGISAIELIGKPVEFLLPKRFRTGHIGYRANYSSRPRTRAMDAGFELYGLHKDGKEFPVEISLSPLETEEGTVVISAIRDISERKHAEEELRLKEERFRLMVENVTDYVTYMLDPDGNILNWNSVAERIKGYTESEIVGVRNGNRADEFGMLIHKGLHVRRTGGFADAVGHVNRVKIRIRNKAVNGFKADMVGVHMIGLVPAEFPDGGIGGGARAGRVAADDGVFPVGFVPDGNKKRAEFGGPDASAKLRLALMRKTVADAE